MNYHTKAYDDMQKLSGFKVGDKVQCLRAWRKGEFGFNLESFETHTAKSDVITKIKSISPSGIQLDHNPKEYFYPFFVLQSVPSSPVEFKLNSGYTALIQPNGDVKVGCQTFEKEKIFGLTAKIKELLQEKKEAPKEEGKIFPYNVFAHDVPVGAIFTYHNYPQKYKQLRAYQGRDGDVQDVNSKKTHHFSSFATVTVESHEKAVPYECLVQDVPVGATFEYNAGYKKDDIITYTCLREFTESIGDCLRHYDDQERWFSKDTKVTVTKLAE